MVLKLYLKIFFSVYDREIKFFTAKLLAVLAVKNKEFKRSKNNKNLPCKAHEIP